MSDHMETIGLALQELIHKGRLSRENDEKLYDSVMENDEVLGDLETVCNNMGLYLHDRDQVFFVSPVPGAKAFCYTNEELRKAMNYSFRNEDMYTALFIIAVIVTEFYPEAGHDQAITFLRLNDIIKLVDERIAALKDRIDLEQISYDNSYNFEIVVKKWLELPMALPDKSDPDEVRNKGRGSKLQMVNTTLQFLREQDLIRIPEDTDPNKFIYVEERFSATVYNIYRNENAQSNIYNLIDGLRQEASDNA